MLKKQGSVEGAVSWWCARKSEVEEKGKAAMCDVLFTRPVRSAGLAVFVDAEIPESHLTFAKSQSP